MRAVPAAVVLAVALAPASAEPAAADPDVLAPAYTVSLTGAQRGFAWRGRERIAFTNPGPAPLERIWVRLWGNGRGGCHTPRAVRIADVRGARVGARAVRCSAVALDLDAPLAPGRRGSVAFRLSIRVPRIADRFGRDGRDVALLSNALPVLALREGGVWRLEPYFAFGEAWVYPTADWTVRLRAPRGVAIAAPGVRRRGGVRHLANGRDYSFAAGRLRHLRATVAGTRVTVWGRHAGSMRLALRRTRRNLTRLDALLGPYGWPDLQVVVTDVSAMEHTALIMSSTQDWVLAHELAHMWWFALIGSDQARAPWLDEGFASYTENVLAGSLGTCRGPGTQSRLLTRGVDYWARRGERYITVYLEGACLLQLVERRLGRERFRTALREYALAHRYGWQTAATFQAAMDAAAGGPGLLADLWTVFGLPAG